ncbi:F-box/kelch-repeat protein At3g06240-like [Apium graveolens]|uniref:F-box/kelch-repeat protein At3g06240-like n=1 Tax=Apium graveolens TaxID=4045 RepID=UPI003D7C13C0
MALPCEMIDESDSSYEDSASVVKICDPLKTLLRGAEYVCACNGLMCVLKNLRDVYLLNPVLRKFKKVASAPPEFPSSFKWDERFSFGFGYDVVNDDYKVVMIADCCVHFGGLLVFVYSFKTNAWTRIQNVPNNISFTGIWGIFASGSLHWTAIKNEIDSEDIIVGFDLELQQFKEVPSPPIEDDSSKTIFLDGVGENLCIIDCSNSRMDVWLMNYPGAESTWYKALSTEQEEMLRINGTSYKCRYSNIDSQSANVLD